MAQIQFLKIIKTLFTASILSILENAPCAFEKSFSLDVPLHFQSCATSEISDRIPHI